MAHILCILPFGVRTSRCKWTETDATTVCSELFGGRQATIVTKTNPFVSGESTLWRVHPHMRRTGVRMHKGSSSSQGHFYTGKIFLQPGMIQWTRLELIFFGNATHDAEDSGGPSTSSVRCPSELNDVAPQDW
eukprot:3409882-Amphidinium_carterae.1